MGNCALQYIYIKTLVPLKTQKCVTFLVMLIFSKPEGQCEFVPSKVSSPLLKVRWTTLDDQSLFLQFSRRTVADHFSDIFYVSINVAD